jgi:hypothetical protein
MRGFVNVLIMFRKISLFKEGANQPAQIWIRQFLWASLICSGTGDLLGLVNGLLKNVSPREI